MLKITPRVSSQPPFLIGTWVKRTVCMYLTYVDAPMSWFGQKCLDNTACSFSHTLHPYFSVSLCLCFCLSLSLCLFLFLFVSLSLSLFSLCLQWKTNTNLQSSSSTNMLQWWTVFSVEAGPRYTKSMDWKGEETKHPQERGIQHTNT